MNLEEITLEKIKERLKGSWDCSVPNNEVEWLVAEVERLQNAARKDISYCAIHHTYPCEGEPCWACAEPFIQKEVEHAEKAEARIRELEKGLREIADNLDTPIALARIARGLLANKM